MAQKIETRYIDDTDGTEASGPVVFGIDGWQYEIDLNDDNAGKLRGALAAFTAAGRRLGRMAKPSKTTATVTEAKPARASREHTAAVRAWARQNGHEVSERGRIPVSVQEAFDAVH